jgi:hypothetical protein
MSRRSGPPEGERRAALARRAATQHGVFTRKQALNAGYTSSAIGHRLRNGIWEVVDYCVYRFAGTPPTWHQRLLGACLAGPAVASHRSAAWLWHLDGIKDPPVEVTALRHRRRFRQEEVIWHESRWLREGDIRYISAIPVTSPTRVILDLAVLGDETLLVLALDDALRRGLTSIPILLEQMERFGPMRPGRKLLETVLDRRIASAIPGSGKETQFDELMRVAGLPEPVRQFRVLAKDGRWLGNADFAFPPHRLLVEIQSMRWHAGIDRQTTDDRRFAAFAAADYRVIPIWANDIRDRPSYVVATIREALGL